MQVGLISVEIGGWDGCTPGVGHSLWWWWVHTALECHGGANREWPNWGICCHSDLMVGGSYM